MFKENLAAVISASLFLLVTSTAYANSVTGAIADPTRPSGYISLPGSDARSYRLESILTGQGRRLAIINGKSYAIGDSTPLGKVQRIAGQRVVIVGQRRHVLEINGKAIKKH